MPKIDFGGRLETTSEILCSCVAIVDFEQINTSWELITP